MSIDIFSKKENDISVINMSWLVFTLTNFLVWQTLQTLINITLNIRFNIIPVKFLSNSMVSFTPLCPPIFDEWAFSIISFHLLTSRIVTNPWHIINLVRVPSIDSQIWFKISGRLMSSLNFVIFIISIKYSFIIFCNLIAILIMFL